MNCRIRRITYRVIVVLDQSVGAVRLGRPPRYWSLLLVDLDLLDPYEGAGVDLDVTDVVSVHRVGQAVPQRNDRHVLQQNVLGLLVQGGGRIEVEFSVRLPDQAVEVLIGVLGVVRCHTGGVDRFHRVLRARVGQHPTQAVWTGDLFSFVLVEVLGELQGLEGDVVDGQVLLPHVRDRFAPLLVTGTGVEVDRHLRGPAGCLIEGCGLFGGQVAALARGPTARVQHRR